MLIVYNYGEAELKDLSEPCIHGQFLKVHYDLRLVHYGI